VTFLLDANVLIALVVADHVHHDAAEGWLAGLSGHFATCPLTQGSLLRFLVRAGQPASTSASVLRAVCEDSRHRFWADELAYTEVRLAGVVGHRQLTDAYLAQLARHHEGRVATFDRAFGFLHDDVAHLVPVG